MIVQISNTGAVQLEDADNFARFSVRIDDVRDNLVVLGKSVAFAMHFDDGDNAWVHVAALPRYEKGTRVARRHIANDREGRLIRMGRRRRVSYTGAYRMGRIVTASKAEHEVA